MSRRAPALLGPLALLLGACAPGDVADPPATPRVVLRAVTGDAQDARAANVALAAPLVVASVDAATGRPVPGVAVAWSTADGALAGEARTDARGEARAEWRLAPRLGTQTAVARLAAGDSAPFRARVVPSDVRLTRDTLVLRVGDRGRAEWVALDANDVALAGAGEVRWAAADPAVAGLDADGTVRALADGATALTADLSALGVARSLRAALVVGVPLAGRVATLDELPPQGLRVFVRTAAGTDSADVAPDGRFALRARSAALREATEVLVDAADRARRRYFPSLWRFTPDAAVPPVDFVLVPQRWQNVALSLNAALGAGLAGPAAGAPWYDRNWFLDRAAPSGAGPALETFPDDAFPLPVYFDRDRSKMPITADDSVAFWQSLDALGTAVGAPLFRPAEKRLLPERALTTSAGTVVTRPYSVAVVVDSVLLQGLAASTWTTACVGATSCAVLDRVDATIFFSGRTRRIRERALVQHEAGHVLGLGHTCYWTSVMFSQLDAASWTAVSPSCARFWQDGVWPEGRIDRADAVTARDAAYLALYLRAAAATRRLGPVHGLFAAFLGERRVLLGLD